MEKMNLKNIILVIYLANLLSIIIKSKAISYTKVLQFFYIC